MCIYQAGEVNRAGIGASLGPFRKVFSMLRLSDLGIPRGAFFLESYIHTYLRSYIHRCINEREKRVAAIRAEVLRRDPRSEVERGPV